MTSTKNLVIVGLITISACVFVGLVSSANGNNWAPWLRGELSNCLRLQAGTGVVELRYPDKFIDVSFNGHIRIKQRDAVDQNKGANEDYILTVDALSFRSLGDVISGFEGGPKYSTSTFNGYEAAFYHAVSEDLDFTDDYIMRAGTGNDGVSVGYHYSQLSAEEKQLADKMLHSIRISSGSDDVKQARVEGCGIINL